MTKKTIVVTSGLEARPAALFVQTASKFCSNIHLILEEKTVNAKSIMGVISLGLLDSHTVTICADGADEENAVDELVGFLQNVEIE